MLFLIPSLTMLRPIRITAAIVATFGWSALTASAQQGDFFASASDYADTMLQFGRDTYGTATPLFVNKLSRTSQPTFLHEQNIGTANKLLPGWESRYYDRGWGGANLGDDIQLHTLLDQLSRDTGNSAYREASDAAIAYTFKKLQNPNTHLLMWGEHLSYDVRADRVYSGTNTPGLPHADTHEVTDRLSPAMWDRIYRVAPDEAFDFALGLWDHQVYDQSTGQFNRHARFTQHGPDPKAANFPRVGGWMTLAWSEAYRRSSNAGFRDEMLDAMTTIANLYEGSISPQTGVIPAGIKTPNNTSAPDFSTVYWLQNNLMLAAELELAIDGLPSPLADRFRQLQAVIDDTALTKLEHNLDGHLVGLSAGFLHRGRPDLALTVGGTLQPGDGRQTGGSALDNYTTDWAYGYGSPLTSSVARLMVERYDANLDARYLVLVEQAADRYLQIEPPSDDLHPMSVSEVIDLLLDVYGVTGKQEYFDGATAYGLLAESMFLAGSPLPKATSSHDFYEAIAGGDDLMLALYRLSETTVPEPATAVLLSFICLMLAFSRRARPEYHYQ